MPSKKTTEQIKNIILGTERYCQMCGYKKYPEALTLHHIYPKRHYPNQSKLKLRRKVRYAVLCANCHLLVEKDVLKYKKKVKK